MEILAEGFKELFQAAREYHVFFLMNVVLIVAVGLLFYRMLNKKEAAIKELNQEIKTLNNRIIQIGNDRIKELSALYQKSNERYSSIADALGSMRDLIDQFFKK